MVQPHLQTTVFQPSPFLVSDGSIKSAAVADDEIVFGVQHAEAYLTG